MANNDLSVRLVLSGDGSQLEGTIKRADGTIQKFGNTVDSSSTKARKALLKAEKQIESTSRATNTLEQRALKLGAALIGAFAARQLATELGRRADQFSLISARLDLVTESGDESAAALARIRSIAGDTGQALGDVATLATRAIRALQSTGRSTEEAISQGLDLAEVVSDAVLVSGAAANEANAAIIQLSQGLASGQLRGEEFRSVMEQTPRVAQALSDALGKTTGELRELAEQGGLTTDVVTEALLNQGKVLEAEASQIPPTIARAWTVLSNEVTNYIGEADQGIQASRGVAESILLLSENLDVAADAVVVLATLVGGRLAGNLAAAAQQKALNIVLAGQLANGWKATAASGSILAAATRGVTAAGRGLLALVGGPVGLAVAVASLAAVFGDDLFAGAKKGREEIEELIKAAENFGKTQLQLRLEPLRAAATELQLEVDQISADLARLRNLRDNPITIRDAESRQNIFGPEIEKQEAALERVQGAFNAYIRQIVEIKKESAAAGKNTALLTAQTDDFGKAVRKANDTLREQLIKLTAGEQALEDYQDAELLAAAAAKDAEKGTTANTEAVKAQIAERERLQAAIAAETKAQESATEAQERQKEIAERLVQTAKDLRAELDPLAERQRELTEQLDQANRLLGLSDDELAALGLTSGQVEGIIAALNDQLDRLGGERLAQIEALRDRFLELAAAGVKATTGIDILAGNNPAAASNDVGRIGAGIAQSTFQGASLTDSIGRSLRGYGGEEISNSLEGVFQDGFNGAMEKLELSDEARENLEGVGAGLALAVGQALEGDLTQAAFTAAGAIVGAYFGSAQAGAAIGSLVGGLFGGEKDPKFQVSGVDTAAERDIGPRNQTRLDTAIGTIVLGLRNIEAEAEDELIAAFQGLATGIAGIVRDVDILADIEDEIADVIFSSKADGVSVKRALEAVFDEIVNGIDDGLAAFVNRGGTFEERIQRFEEAFTIGRRLVGRRGLGLTGEGFEPDLTGPTDPGFGGGGGGGGGGAFDPGFGGGGGGAGPDPGFARPKSAGGQSAAAEASTFSAVLEGVGDAADITNPALLQTLDLLDELRIGSESLADTFDRLVAVTNLLDSAVGLTGAQIGESREDLVRFGADLVAFFGDSQELLGQQLGRVLNRLFTDEELAAQRAETARARLEALVGDLGIDFTEALASESGFRGLFDQLFGTLSPEDTAILIEAGVALDDLLLAEAALAEARGESVAAARDAAAIAEILAEIDTAVVRENLDGLDRDLFDVGQEFDRLRERLLEAGASAADLAALEERRADARDRVIEAEQARNAAELADVMAGVNEEIFALTRSPLRNELRGLRRRFEQLRSTVTQLGGAEQALGRVRRLEALELDALASQIRASLADLVATFNGESQELGRSELDRIGEVQQAAEQRYQREIQALERIGDLVDSLLLSSISPLTPGQRVDEARRQFETTLSAARGGDIGALEDLPGVAQQFLAELRAATGGVGEFPAEFDRVLDELAALEAAGPQSANPSQRPPTAADVINAADRIVDELSALERAQVASAILDQIGLLASIDQEGRSPSEIAAALGVDISEILEALTGDVPRATGEALADEFDRFVTQASQQADRLLDLEVVSKDQLAEAERQTTLLELILQALGAEVPTPPPAQSPGGGGTVTEGGGTIGGPIDFPGDPDIPAFAAGGFASGLVRTGERGRELILPNPVTEFFARVGVPINASIADRAVLDRLEAIERAVQVNTAGHDRTANAVQTSGERIATATREAANETDRALARAVETRGGR